MFEWLRTYVLSREDAEFIFFVAQTAISIIALAALLYAREQVSEARKNTQIIAQQAQATSLLSLEQRWNSEQMREARTCLVALSAKLREEVFKLHSGLNDSAVMGKVQQRFTEELARLQKEDLTGQYVLMMRIFGFFETIGILVKREYTDIGDVDALLRGPVLEFGLYYETHITHRQNEKGTHPGLGENALYLVTEIKRLAQSRLLS